MTKYKAAGNMTVLVDDSVGTPRDISAHVTEIDTFGREYTPVDDTVYADTAESAVAGIEASQEFGLKGFLDDAATTGSDTVLSGIIGTIVTVKVTAKSGVRSFSCEALCISYKITGDLKGFVMFEARFKQDGVVTVAT